MTQHRTREDLFPCPFCGCAAERHDIMDEEPANFGGSVIQCTKCLCSTRVIFGEKEGLYEAWNTRATSSLRAENERLRAATQPAASPSNAVRDVLHERERQRRVEGFTAARDDQYKTGELRRAAVSYVLNTLNSPKAFDWWPWDLAWLKPHGTRRDLVKAGALILAEIERLDRVRMDQESRGDG